MKILANIFLILMLSSCANMVAPDGGDKDFNAPKLQNIEVIEDKKDGPKKTIKFEFNEYIQLNNWEYNFYISPPVTKRIQKKIKAQQLLITIDEMLNKNTTYYIALNACIKDNNEGNILDTLSYKLSTNNSLDTLTLSGYLKDAYTLSVLKNSWVMLFNEDVCDSLIFKKTPNYIAKTDKNGIFHFPNLKDRNYKIVAVTDFDFIYSKKEKIAFADSLINPKNDSFISLYAFDPIPKTDSTSNMNKKLEGATASTCLVLDSIIEKEKIANAKLEIITNKESPCFFQLIKEEEVISEFYFAEKPYLITGIVAGDYHIKYFADNNNDSIWNTGNWEMRIQPEKVVKYTNEITIRSNWDLELKWIIED